MAYLTRGMAITRFLRSLRFSRFLMFALVLAVPVSAAIFYFYRANHVEKQQIYAGNIRKQQEERIGTCWSLQMAQGTAAWLSCLNRANADQLNFDKSRYDLQAQQDMADWSLGTMILAALALGVTSFGAYYVKRTLDLTVIATKAAIETTTLTAKQLAESQKTFEGEVRAVLKCDSGTFRAISEIIHVDLLLENERLTEASACELMCVAIIPLFEPYGWQRVHQIKQFELGTREKKWISFSFQVDAYQHGVSSSLYRRVEVNGANFKLNLKWRDVFGVEHERAFFACGSGVARRPERDGKGCALGLVTRPTDPLKGSDYENPGHHSDGIVPMP